MGNEVRQFISGSKSVEYADALIADRRVQALDFDYERRFLYWTDSSLKTVKRALVPEDQSELGHPQDLGISGMVQPNGIAFDWVAK